METRLESTRDPDRIAALNEEVQELHRRLYPAKFKPFSFDAVRAFLSARMESPDWRCLVAVADGEDAGYVLYFRKDYAENPFRRAYLGVGIDQICVREKYRRLGLGKALMRAVEAEARTLGATQLELTFWDANAEARGFYAGEGFSTRMEFSVKEL